MRWTRPRGGTSMQIPATARGASSLGLFRWEAAAVRPLRELMDLWSWRLFSRVWEYRHPRKKRNNPADLWSSLRKPLIQKHRLHSRKAAFVILSKFSTSVLVFFNSFFFFFFAAFTSAVNWNFFLKRAKFIPVKRAAVSRFPVIRVTEQSRRRMQEKHSSSSFTSQDEVMHMFTQVTHMFIHFHTINIHNTKRELSQLDSSGNCEAIIFFLILHLLLLFHWDTIIPLFLMILATTKDSFGRENLHYYTLLLLLSKANQPVGIHIFLPGLGCLLSSQWRPLSFKANVQRCEWVVCLRI